MKKLLSWFDHFHTACAKSRPARRPHSVRLELERLEDRELLSITDMTQLAQMFSPHVGATMLYLNFDGGQISYPGGSENIAPYQSAPGGNRDADINAVITGISRIYAPFNLIVQRIYGYGVYDSGNNNTTIFFGGDTSNVYSGGIKYQYSFTPAAFVDTPCDYKGYGHQPHSDPYNLAFVDPVVNGAGASWATPAGAVNYMISNGAHEAGHTFGLEHVLTGGSPDIMSYDSSNQRVVSQTFNVTDLNNNGQSIVHGGSGYYAKWAEWWFGPWPINVDTITTQDSYTYLMAVLGHHHNPAPNAVGINQIVSASNADGRLQEFIIGWDHALWSRWQLSPNSNNWSNWTSFGGWSQQITVGTDADGRMEVFAIGSNNAMWDIYQVAPSSGWSSWTYFGGWITQMSVGTDADGRMEVFTIGSNNAMWDIYQVAPSSGWSSWTYFGGWSQQITVGINADGRLQVFAIGSSNALFSIWQLSPGAGWGSWTYFGGWSQEIAVGIDLDGRMEVFTIGSNNALWDIYQVAPSSGWSSWTYFGGWSREITVGTDADGRMEVFAIGSDNALWDIYQLAPNSGWSNWTYFGGSFSYVTVTSNADGRLEVFGVGVDNQEYDLWQTAPNSGWARGSPSPLP
jgi:hypothetical protein